MSQLEDLLQQCTVKLTLPDRMGWGTGFFVAPERILTCAHVVQEAKGQPIQVRWQKQDLEGVVERSLSAPYDLALLRMTQPIDGNPTCVYLDAEIRSRDPLYLFGYPDQDFPNGCPVTFSCEGLTGDEPALVKFALGQVRPGMSGSPLLNQRTGKVCGMVKFTRDRSLDLGGGAVPTAVVLEQFPELVEWQRSFHKLDTRWVQQLEGAIAANSATSPTARAILPLSAYDPATWVGRDSLVASLSQKLKDGCRILALTGITGIGKTTLAERLVVEVSGSDAPFHRLNFDDRGQRSDFLSGALHLLPKLGETVTIEDQKDPQNTLKHLLQTLKDKQFVVQIDSLEVLLQGNDQTGWNAFADPLWVDFFQQLLAGESCQSQLLLTTQALSEELEIVGTRYPRYWYRQNLSGLSEAEQLQLFEKNGLKLDDDGAKTLKRIGKLYDGHPLVIQVIAKDILEKPFNGNVQQYWRRYQAEFDEMEGDKQKGISSRSLQLRVKQRVEQSLKRLPFDSYQMLCRSSVYRRPVPEEFWLAMVESSLDDKQWIALELLKSYNLLEEELRTDGLLLLRQHNLIRGVAYRLLQKDDVAWREAERTAAKVWLHDYEPESDAPKLEHVRGFLEAFHHSCELGNWELAKTILIDEELGYRLRIWGYSREMLSLYEQLIGKVDASVDVICEKGIGSAYWFLSQYPEAIQHTQRGLAIAREIGDRRGEETALGDLGYAYYALSAYHQALEYHQQRLNIAREIGYRLGECTALAGIGMVYSALGNYFKAMEYQQQSLIIAREIGDRNGEGNALGSIGSIYYLLGNYSQAIEYQQQLLQIAKEIGKRRGEADALGNLGDIYSAMGNYPQAIEYYQQSLQITREVGQRRNEGIVLTNWGATLIKLEQYSEAQHHLQTALAIFQNLGERNGEAQALHNLAKLHQKAGKIDQARDCCDRALSIASELGIPLVKECEELQVLLATAGTIT